MNISLILNIELFQEERHIRYFNIRNSDIPKLENQIFMGIKIEHLYIHDSNLKVRGANLTVSVSLLFLPS